MNLPTGKIFDKKEKRAEKGITLVIPVYNRLGQVEHTLESVAAQTRLPERIILVDNSSTDGSWEYLFKWKEDMEKRGVRVSVKREPRPGASRARNTGLQFVETEYVMFFDSDDCMVPEHIERIMSDFEGDPSLDMSIWQMKYILPSGKGRSNRLWADGSLRQLIDNHLIQGMLTTAAYAVRVDFMKRAGNWNPSIGGWDDFELGLRLLIENPRVKLNREARVDKAVQEDSISGLGFSHRLGDWEKTLDAMEEFVREKMMNPEVENAAVKDVNLLEHILRMIDYRRINLAAHYRREGYSEESIRLRDTALQGEFLTKKDICILRMAYRYTSTGLPGAGAIFAPLIS